MGLGRGVLEQRRVLEIDGGRRDVVGQLQDEQGHLVQVVAGDPVGLHPEAPLDLGRQEGDPVPVLVQEDVQGQQQAGGRQRRQQGLAARPMPVRASRSALILSGFIR
jgi:hypothetical protein